ncbi:alpha/beta fold hydrolase [Streptomyces nanshensis]|uniref:Alpha/beta hydrolase n=1 Tax=Streptomyces nanshensis TaxID=518642 RepID=A0A1E7KVK6_9ACTN|nr:alpha/beta hydrolase [Streptomyces nanshensis]OEV07956.1 alpha/beta hydrolase [Streptomyces nanshensis]
MNGEREQTVSEAGRHTQGTAAWAATPDGRRLYTMELPGPSTAGEKDVPTVVFEAGAAATRSTWAPVQVGVSGFARAVVYDRSGLGRSAPDPAGRTLDRMADDLNAVLDHAGPGPFVLVGHSAGGPIVRLAASRRPERIAGLVLVDPTDEAADVLFRKTFRRAERVWLAVGGAAARLGLFKRAFRWLLAMAPAEDVREDLAREAFTPGVLRTQREQARTFLDELEVWRETPPALGDIPVTVISGTRTGDGMPKAVRAAANASHAHRAAQSPRGRHVLAEESGHYVPLTEPDVVVDAVNALVTPGR